MTHTSELGADALLELHHFMCLARIAEERVESLFSRGLVSAAIYRSLGQEAGSVGAAAALRRREDGTGDVVAQSFRGCGAIFLLGATVQDYFRQYVGKAGAPTGGRDAGTAFTRPDLGILGPIAPLGAMLEVMSGVALGFQLRGEDRVAMVFTGDGATSTGAWHEGLAFASARRCPLVLVVENNQWAFSTPTTESVRVSSFTEKAPGYGIDAESVDGTDVLAVYGAAARAVERARTGAGVQLLELRYFRRRGHAQHDAQDYVDPEEIRAWEEKDPVTRFEQYLVESGTADKESLTKVRENLERMCAEVADTVIAEPDPEGAAAMLGVYDDRPPETPWTRLVPADPRRTRLAVGKGA